MEHYVELCRDAVSVLELGSGYGRMLRALAEPERELFGLELDPSLLALGKRTVAGLPAAARRGVTLVQGDMQRIALGRRFERVLLPYNALYCLLSARAVQRCFRAVRAALEPGGLFAFDVWNADHLVAAGLSPAGDERALAAFEHAGRRWVVTERCQGARGADRIDVTYTYAPSGSGAQRSQSLRQRYYRSTELCALLGESGFALVSQHGSFAKARFDERSARLVVVARALP